VLQQSNDDSYRAAAGIVGDATHPASSSRRGYPRAAMVDLADAAAAVMDEGLQDSQRHQDNFTRFLERDVRVRSPRSPAARRGRSVLCVMCVLNAVVELAGR